MVETLRDEELRKLLVNAQPFTGIKPPAGAEHIGSVFHKGEWYKLYRRVERFGEDVIYYDTPRDIEQKKRQEESVRQWTRATRHPWDW